MVLPDLSFFVYMESLLPNSILQNKGGISIDTNGIFEATFRGQFDWSVSFMHIPYRKSFSIPSTMP